MGNVLALFGLNTFKYMIQIIAVSLWKLPREYLYVSIIPYPFPLLLSYLLPSSGLQWFFFNMSPFLSFVPYIIQASYSPFPLPP